jgi:serine protease Do
MRQFLTPLFLGVCAFLGGAAAVHLAGRGPLPAFAHTAEQPPPPAAPGTDVVRLSERFEAVARKVSPAVVAIDAIKPASRGTGESKAVEESGSGVLIRVAGKAGVFVLTNNHVIQQAAPAQINVTTADNHIFKAAQVWADPETDIAVLRLDTAENLPTATLGDSDAMRVGHWVLAVGSPFGLNQTVTHGIISARERGQISLGTTIRIKDFLQTDAAINPGSSGGPLVNLDGDVIGINTAIASKSRSSSGVAFSIPINLIKTVVKQLLEKGSVTRGYLGLQVAASFEAADAAKLGLDKAQGALVEVVYPDTPAAAAGIRAKDVVLEVDGVAVRNENHFINLISELPAGKRVRVQLWRDRRTMSVDAEVGDWTKAQSRFKSNP